MRKVLLHGPVLMLSLMLFDIASAAAASKVIFLGSDPKFIASTPMSIAELSGGAIDAAGNGYYANSRTGTVVRLTPEGDLQTLMSGLKQPHLAIDYRGDVFVSDTGNNRVLSLPAGTRQPLVRAQMPGPGSIAADASGNLFFLCGGALYEVTGGGQPRKIGSFPNAVMLAYGPASGESDTMYILSTKPNSGVASSAAAYTVSKYAYRNTAGAISNGPAFSTADSIEDFGVDAEGNLILGAVTKAAGSSQPQTYLFEVTPSDETLALTRPIAGSIIHLAIDYNRTLFYVDAQGIYQLMKSTVDFGLASQQGGTNIPTTLVLNFSLPAGVGVASTSYTVDGYRSEDFQDGFPFDASCPAGSPICSLPVSFLPQDLGVTGAILSLLDANGHTLVQVPLHGDGSYPLHELFVEHENAMPDPPTTGSLKDPAGISSSTTQGPIVTDLGLGRVFTPYSSEFAKGGLGKPETVAHFPAGNTYITQASTAGVLTVHPDHSTTRIATQLATEPNGVAVDGIGNVYISDRTAIFRVGLDGVEAQLASPATDGGYTSVQSLAVDPAGNTYAYFASGGPGGRGGLLKITPAGVATPVATDAASAAGLALDMGGGIYVSDPVNHSLETLRTDGTWMTLLTGLQLPRGVTALFGPLMVDEGAKQLIAPTVPQSVFNFGNVPVGTTVTRTFTVFALGNAQTVGELFFDGFDSAFTTGGGYKIDPGGSQTVTVSFTPTYPGPHNVTLYDEGNDYFSEQPIVQQYTVTGVGTEPTTVTPLK